MDENKLFKGLAYCGVFVFVFAVCWYLLREPDVSDQRDAAARVAESLGRAGSEQRNAERNLVNVGRGIDSGIERADEIERGIDEAESRIADVQSRGGECAEILADSERRIEESRAILQSVRSRAGQNGK